MDVSYIIDDVRKSIERTRDEICKEESYIKGLVNQRESLNSDIQKAHLDWGRKQAKLEQLNAKLAELEGRS